MRIDEFSNIPRIKKLIDMHINYFSIVFYVYGDHGKTAVTTSGTVRGFTNYAKDSDIPVHTFLGIPYAKSPVGDLRFRKPEPAPAWDGIRQTTNFGKCCICSTDVNNHITICCQYSNKIDTYSTL